MMVKILLVIVVLITVQQQWIVLSHPLKDGGLNCEQYRDDFDVIAQFPFPVPVLYNPRENPFNQTLVEPDESRKWVQELYIQEENEVPLSLFCLTHLHRLYVVGTQFPNYVLPDELINLTELRELWIYNTKFNKVTDNLGKMTMLEHLFLHNTGISSVPDLSGLVNLWQLSLARNHLRSLSAIPNLRVLDLEYNLFEEIPDMGSNDTLVVLDMSGNPLRNFNRLTWYHNMKDLLLEETGLKSIPTNIDQLQNLLLLDFENNEISQVPRNVLNLANLESLNLQGNPISARDVNAIRQSFENMRSNVSLYF